MRLPSSTRLLAIVLAAGMLTVPFQSIAQPSSIGPQDIARLKQHSDFTDTWFDTNLYDLKHPIELFVTIIGLDVPERGYAQLYFTIDSKGRGESEVLSRGQVAMATLQLAGIAKHQGATTEKLQRGTQVRLLGWPATSDNVTDSVMLVDEILITNRGERIRFHPDHPAMTTLREGISIPLLSE